MRWKVAIKKPILVEFREVEKKTLIRRKWDADNDVWIEVWGEVIDTLEGLQEARPERDYIIKGIRGECYPIKKEIFYERYEVIE